MPGKSKPVVLIEQIDGMIHTIRGVRVMLDRDLAKIYGVPTFRFNEAIKRNRHRFPKDFMFQLSRPEFDSLTSQIAMSKPQDSSQNAMSKTGRGGRRTLPYAFTEHGCFQLITNHRSLITNHGPLIPVSTSCRLACHACQLANTFGVVRRRQVTS
jgi:ORF6N domain